MVLDLTCNFTGENTCFLLRVAFSVFYTVRARIAGGAAGIFRPLKRNTAQAATRICFIAGSPTADM